MNTIIIWLILYLGILSIILCYFAFENLKEAEKARNEWIKYKQQDLYTKVLDNILNCSISYLRRLKLKKNE